jgi:hypothetical protein
MKSLMSLLLLTAAALSFSGCGHHDGNNCNAPHPVTLTWNASTSTDVTAYNLYRGNQSGGPYSLVGSVDGSTLKYSDSCVATGSTYFYVATASNSVAESVYSNEAPAIVPSSALNVNQTK